MSTILFDDPHIQALWHPGQSDFLLITFGDLLTFADGVHFFADTPVQKLGLAALGIMPKGPNWFPAASMQALSQKIQETISPFRERVLYGGSMGGYAAIKYSRLLSASHVLALCPQWSLDLHECEGHYPGWLQYFRPEMVGMGIKPQDVQGRVYVFSDHRDPIDDFHRRMIIKNYPDTVSINVPSVAHGVTTVFAGTQNLNDLIDACRFKDARAVIAITSPWRRRHAVRINIVLERAFMRHGRLARKMIEARLAHGTHRAGIAPWVLFKALHHCLMADKEETYRFIDKMKKGLTIAEDKIRLSLIEAQMKKQSLKIFTYHKTVLLYDPIEGVCRHINPEVGNTSFNHCIPVHIRFSGDEVALFIISGDVEMRLGVRQDYLLSLVPLGTGEARKERFTFHCIRQREGHLALSWGNLFISAEPSGRIICNRSPAREWEFFHFMSL